jgi:hypothetical protein
MHNEALPCKELRKRKRGKKFNGANNEGDQAQPHRNRSTVKMPNRTNPVWLSFTAVVYPHFRARHSLK